MSRVTRNTSAWAVCAAILVLCSTGCCMLSPQHGQVIESTSEPVLFVGATTSPDQDIVIEGWHPIRNRWEFIEDFHTLGTGYGYTESDGTTCYRWPAILDDGYRPIPTWCWKASSDGPEGTTYEAEVRAIIAGTDQGLPTVEDGFRYSPFGSQGSIHGDSVTVYAKVSKGR